MSDRTTTPASTKKFGAITLAFMVIAMAAPVGVVVGLNPLVFAHGNGVGAPATYALVAVVLVTFSFGIAAMAQQVRVRGGFFAFIGVGLGERAGMAAGFVSAASYSILLMYVSVAFGYYTAVTLAEFGVDVHWSIPSIALVVTVALLALSGVKESARVAMWIVSAEFVVLFALNAAILLTKGPGAFTLRSFAPTEVFGGNPGFALALVYLAFIGFEATTVYRDHVVRPERTIGRATILAVVIIGVVYALSAWSGIAAIGADLIVQQSREQGGVLYFSIAATAIGPWFALVLQLMLLVSLIATCTGGFGAASQYVRNVAGTFGARRWLAQDSPRTGAPTHAVLTLAGAVLALIAIAAASGIDPYHGLAALLSAVGSVGVIALQAVCALAIFVHFRRRADARIFTTAVAPLLALMAMLASLVLILVYFEAISGATAGIAGWSLAGLAVAAVAGWSLGKGRSLTASTATDPHNRNGDHHR